MHPIIKRLLKIRDESGLTDSQLIEISGRSYGFWHRLKYAGHIPTDSTIFTISKNLYVNARWIKYGDGEPDWEIVRKKLKEKLKAQSLKKPDGNKQVEIQYPENKDAGLSDAVQSIAKNMDIPEDKIWESLLMLKQNMMHQIKEKKSSSYGFTKKSLEGFIVDTVKSIILKNEQRLSKSWKENEERKGN